MKQIISSHIHYLNTALIKPVFSHTHHGGLTSYSPMCCEIDVALRGNYIDGGALANNAVCDTEAYDLNMVLIGLDTDKEQIPI